MFAFLSLILSFIVAPAWALTLSPTSVTVNVGATATSTVSNRDGTVTATSANTAIATASYASGIVTVRGVAAGSTSVTVRDNESSSTLSVTVTPPPDTQAPTAPTNLAATAASSTQINLSWTASTDNVGVTGYRIERCQGAGCSSFTQIASTTGTGTTFSNTGLTAGTSYSYRVRANDAAGNLSGYSNIASRTTPTATDTQAPTAPTNLAATAASATQINLSWTASTDNVGVTGYLIERCQGAGCSSFAQIATSTTTTFNNTGLTASTSYSYRVRATDAAGNLSAYSSIASATTPAAADTQAPTAPTSLAAAAASSTQINLSWTASTDNVGVTNYLIERCQGAGCSSFAQITTSTTTTFNNTGLTASTSYSYRVRATDAAGNLSGYSNTASATTPAVQAGGGNPGPSTKSINSTSQSCGLAGQPNCGTTDVGEQPRAGQAGSGNTAYKVLAVNDLGMHCGDLDTRISSILPPFNVLRAVVVQMGLLPTRNPTGISVTYSAGSNPADPKAALAPERFSAGGVYKTNFWGIGQAAYDPFYPGTSTALNPFAAPYNLTMPVDQSLPMPDVEQFYLGTRALEFNQQPMPGLGTPYNANAPTSFALQVATQPFFTSFAFGYTSGVNWWTAEGVPISAFDDFGRENPYPLMRVQAKQGNTVVATTDTVAPISGEASCQSCHAAASDAQSVNVQLPKGGVYGVATTAIGTVQAGSVQIALNDPQLNQVPLAVSVEWASDHNILKLHDIRNPTAPRLITGTTEDFPTKGATPFKAVVCQTCHYTPALDLAQLGPLDGATGTLGNGRQQGNNQSMSRVMHNHHGVLDLSGKSPGDTGYNAGTNGSNLLFAPMPSPAGRNVATKDTILAQTCYMCHPGKKTACLRGAMGQANVVCQDCHGSMTQVGNDFSRNKPGGNFILAGDFYNTTSTTPRVPWANEPGCGSCHTGDAMSNSTTLTGAIPAADGIRLLQAYRNGDAKATPIVPTNKRFAEDTVAATDNPAAAGNPKLYRVSVGGAAATNGGQSGHSGLFCEACHGATHAEWSTSPSVPAANDNVTSNQLQGHAGVISECSTCHGSNYTGTNLNGPHGMHPVGNTTFATDGGHPNLARSQTAACQSCHGRNGQGTVLSKLPVARTLGGTSRPAGYQVSCGTCHSNFLSTGVLVGGN